MRHSYKDFVIEDEYKSDWDKFKMWDLKIKNTEETFRAYSMANYPAEKNLIKLNIRIATPPWENAKKQFYECPSRNMLLLYLFTQKG